MNLFSLVKRRGKGAGTTADNRLSLNPAASAEDLQYCKIIADARSAASASIQSQARKRLQQMMAVIPSGTTHLEPNSLAEHNAGHPEPIAVKAFYIDRLAVTNAEYDVFVSSGIYDDMELWPMEVWQHVLQFVDRSGLPGPQSWSGGKPPRDRLRHPVIGISWYEAMAYANWVGKRLPDAAQWQRSASWHTGQNGQQTALRHPWGNSFDSTKANTWSSGVGSTVPVDKYHEGCTPNGVHQLIGNVWEWIDGAFVAPWNENHLLGGYAEIRGGAFDTYFESQTRIQFRSGQPLLFRGGNVGFRCCIHLDEVQIAPQATATA